MPKKDELTAEDHAIHALLCFAETLLHGKGIDLPLPTAYMREVADHLEMKTLVNDSNLRSVQNVAEMLEEDPRSNKGE